MIITYHKNMSTPYTYTLYTYTPYTYTLHIQICQIKMIDDVYYKQCTSVIMTSTLRIDTRMIQLINDVDHVLLLDDYIKYICNLRKWPTMTSHQKISSYLLMSTSCKRNYINTNDDVITKILLVADDYITTCPDNYVTSNVHNFVATDKLRHVTKKVPT